jgi:hypothetical protein
VVSWLAVVSGLAPRWAAKQPHQSVVNPTGDKPPHRSRLGAFARLHAALDQLKTGQWVFEGEDFQRLTGSQNDRTCLVFSHHIALLHLFAAS